MSTAIAERPHNAEVGTSLSGTVVRPQLIGIAAEQQRATAEIQAALTVAKHSRRDEVDAVDRIKTACQRVRLAECAEYVYDRGGTEITGPTIDLLTVIANCWGNIQFGFRELSQQNGESTVEAFAWDLETNSKNVKTFTVPHKRTARGKTVTLTDPRDIYETVANQAQRRVRACLEAVIPPDVVEDAVAQCRATLKETAQVTPDSIAKLLEAFGKLGVTAEQLQKRLGRRMDAMQPAQLVNLRRIYKSITDGMSKPSDWFEATETAEQPPAPTAADAAKDALRKKSSPPVDETNDRPQTGDEPDAELIGYARMVFEAAKEAQEIEFELSQIVNGKQPNAATLAAINGIAKEYRAALKKASK